MVEEGLASEIENAHGGTDSRARLAARSLLANAPGTLDTITTLADWHRAYADIGPALYAVSAEAVRAIATRIGRGALFSLLAEVGTGARFEDAYRACAGETLDELVARLTSDLALDPTVSVDASPDASGNLTWTLSAFAPNTDVRVSIIGNGYDLVYTVRTDTIGLYHGTFGSTAPRGVYTLSAATAHRYASAKIDTNSTRPTERPIER